MKNNTNYFSHDGNASQDPKIMELLMNHSLQWYWLYWRIVEMLFNADWYKLETSKCKAIAYQVHLPLEMFNEIFEFFVESWLLIEKNGVFWSDSLLKRMSLKEEIRQKRINSWRQWWIAKSKQKLASATEKPSKIVAEASNKSKVKESKVNNKYIIELEEFKEKWNKINLVSKNKLNWFKQLNKMIKISDSLMKIYKRRRKEYSIDEIRLALNNYFNDIQNREYNERWYHNHRWTLLEFLTRDGWLNTFINK